jgi:fused signal recognition particle receptor
VLATVLAIVAVALVLAVVAGVATSRRRAVGRRTRERDSTTAPSRREPAPREKTLPRRPAREPFPAPEIPIQPTGLGSRIRWLFAGGRVTDETWQELEDALIRSDVGPRAAAAVVQRVREAYSPGTDPASLVMTEVARRFEGDDSWAPPTGAPAIVMVVGVNGTGKTTTIGKLANLFRREGRSVTLAASDTFRAAAGEQLDTWAGRAGAHLVSQSRGADPGAVAFDAVQAARARGSDVLIVDTAGRLHTRTPLMEELGKVKRVLEKGGGRVDEVLLVLDATTGQNGIAQARAFTEAVDVTGVVLTKMDGTARGGIVLAVREELGVPVRYVGTGEGLDDLTPFDPGVFARRLVA